MERNKKKTVLHAFGENRPSNETLLVALA